MASLAEGQEAGAASATSDFALLQRRLAALQAEARPSFADSLQVARLVTARWELIAAAAACRCCPHLAVFDWVRSSADPSAFLDPSSCRPAPLDQQVASCRLLARALPSSLPPALSAELVALAVAWFEERGSADSSSDAAPAAGQLQAEAAQLFLALFGTARVKLPPQSGRQLLQLACRHCRLPALLPANSDLAGQQPLTGIAMAELACSSLDLLAQLPQWYPQAPKSDVATAVGACAAAVEEWARRLGGSRAAAPPDGPAATRLLCKLLRALQTLLAEVRVCVELHPPHA